MGLGIGLGFGFGLGLGLGLGNPYGSPAKLGAHGLKSRRPTK